MGLSTVYDRLDDQITTHRPKVVQQRVLGLGPFGQPEGFFVYGRGVHELECACDLEIKREKRREPDGREVEVVRCVGLQLLCPRCSGGLYIRGLGFPNGRAIHVHWERMTQSTVDGLWRPLVSVEGPFGCDYSWHEHQGLVLPRESVMRDPCGFRGVLEAGRLYDHGLVRSATAA